MYNNICQVQLGQNAYSFIHNRKIVCFVIETVVFIPLENCDKNEDTHKFKCTSYFYNDVYTVVKCM